MRNRLADETSPYLLQHADNPVHWQPWDETALAIARAENRPILLSIGYSACHWCHVMAHESFEDPGTAELMNALYVNVKVDREERPDLDHIYQIAHQLLTGRAGGWPLTVFLKPDDRLPIFAGTYFPKQARHGLPDFATVLTRVEQYYRNNAAEIGRYGAALVEALDRLGTGGEAGEPTSAPIRAARRALTDAADRRHGGFGDAPKFPQATSLDFLLTEHAANGDTEARCIAVESLTAMARRGLYDQLGGGFFRYSVDADWTIPHFEKMLYDNASLLALYSDAFAATGEPLFARVARETAAWLTADMQHPDGGFFATLDADSEGEEGRYYVWQREAFDAALHEPLRDIAGPWFGLDRRPNFEGRAWHLHASADIEQLAAARGIDIDTAFDRIRTARTQLLTARGRRVPPARDEKRLTAWNGLAIRGLARAARQLGDPAIAAPARHAADFIATRLWDGNRLYASYKDGRARFPAYLDDHAFVAAGLVELLQVDWHTAHLTFATQLADTLLARFEDPAGGFFFVADDHETLIHRPRLFADDSLPSGNGIAAILLFTLGHLLGEARYLDAAERTVASAMPHLEQRPQAHATLLAALRLALEPPEIIVVRAHAGDAADWRQTIERNYAPQRLAFVIPADTEGLPGLLAERTGGTQSTAWLCRGTACEAPLTSIDALAAALGR